MHHEFWHERWQTGQTSFHRTAAHPMLERWWPTLGLAADARVYVPLCGKSLDMVWLASRGHAVVGSELSPIAVDEFFAGQGLVPRQSQVGGHMLHAAGPWSILLGDALALGPAATGTLAAAYDRAAVVALPPDLRARHARAMADLLPAGARALVITFEYRQSLKDGPPFSVPAAEMHALFDRDFELEELERVELIDESPKFVEAGITSLHEVAWRLTRRG